MLSATVLLGLAACGGDPRGTYELPSEEASAYATAYIAAVVADPEGDDLQRGAGEHVVLRSNWDLRTDTGGWWVEDTDGHRLSVGTGTQIEPGAEVRLYPSCGENTETAVFSCLEEEVLDDGGDVLRLLDSAGTEVARFSYGTAS